MKQLFNGPLKGIGGKKPQMLVVEYPVLPECTIIHPSKTIDDASRKRLKMIKDDLPSLLGSDKEFTYLGFGLVDKPAFAEVTISDSDVELARSLTFMGAPIDSEDDIRLEWQALFLFTSMWSDNVIGVNISQVMHLSYPLTKL